MSIIQGTSKAAGGAYTIDQSLRLDGTGDMSRTVGSDGNLRKWTFAFWLKRTAFGTNGGLGFNVGGTYVDGNNRSIFRFYSSIAGGDDDWYWAERSGAAWREDQATSIMYRDPSAWAHYMCVWDTDGGTTPRARRYVNGVSVDSDLKSGGTLAAANVDSGTNKAGTFQLFDQPGFPGREYEGYCADMYFLDGIAATPADFGTLDAGTGRFLPKEYTGSFGSNGFYLDFADSADLGKDVSGNGNHFTTSGILSTDQVTDSPTDNFCVLNPIDTATTGTLSDGNLVTSGNAKVTMRPSSGQWYYEKDGVGVSYDADTSGQFDPTLTAGTYNFGQSAWSDTGPTGSEKVLSTANFTDTTITTSGSFTGNASADGPFIYLNGVPTAMTINGNSVTFATHADKLANGFKVRTSSSSYNASGSNSYSISTTGAAFADNANAQGNP